MAPMPVGSSAAVCCTRSKMADYRIVKYCRMCKKRYVVDKGQSKKNYCDDCQKRMEEYYNNSSEEEVN